MMGDTFLCRGAVLGPMYALVASGWSRLLSLYEVQTALSSIVSSNSQSLARI